MAVAENCAGNATWAAALDMMLTENKTGTANSQTRVMSDRNFIFFTSSSNCSTITHITSEISRIASMPQKLHGIDVVPASK
jgi:hypothetical protein